MRHNARQCSRNSPIPVLEKSKITMLIEFTVANFRSFLDPQTLSMVAGPSNELREKNVFTPSIKGSPQLLKSAVLYGANGSGKSNLITALLFMRQMVLSSSINELVPPFLKRKSFLFEKKSSESPSEFEIIFIANNIRYQYGFTLTDTEILSEWLFAYPRNRAQRWFARNYNSSTQKYGYTFSSNLSGKKKIWADSTRKDALFLSTAVQLNSDQLKPIRDWFARLVIISHGIQLDKDFTIKNCEDEQEETIAFLKQASIDVDGIEIRKEKSGNEDHINLYDFLKSLRGDEIKKVFFRHYSKDIGKEVLLPLTDESDGTQKLFAYTAPWLDTLKNGRVLIVDELDNSFHPNIVRYLLGLINSKKNNLRNGQLVFSTHNTSILDAKILRRDQVWFIEKDRNLASNLYPLTDFHPRKDEALEKGYLQGRFGAIPYIGEVLF